MSLRSALAGLLLLVSSLVSPGNANGADITFCNKTVKTAWVAVGYYADAWYSKGWFKIESGKCLTPNGPGDTNNRQIYFWAELDDSDYYWSGEGQVRGAVFCTAHNAFLMTDQRCSNTRDAKRRLFKHVELPPEMKLNISLSVAGLNAPDVKIGTIQERCLVSWDDPPQPHSTEIELKWGYQRLTQRMKKLRHCIKLKVVGRLMLEV